MSEEGKPGFEQEAAERELEELRRAIEESRVRRRRANEAFDQFLKGFDQGPRRDAPPPAVVAPRPSMPPAPPAAPVPPPMPVALSPPVPPAPPPPAPVVSAVPPAPAPPAPRGPVPGGSEDPAATTDQLLDAGPGPSDPGRVVRTSHVPGQPAPGALNLARTDEALLASPPPSTSWTPDAIEASEPAFSGSLADFAEERAAASARAQLPTIPAALTPPAPQPRNRRLPALAAVAGVVILATVFLVRREDTAPPDAAQSSPAVTVPPPAPPPANTSAAQTAPPAAEISTSRRVWLRVTVDGERVVEREVDAGTKIPLTPTSQLIVRTGDAGAVHVSLAGKDQGPLGPAGQVVTRSFVVKPANGRTGEPVK